MGKGYLSTVIGCGLILGATAPTGISQCFGGERVEAPTMIDGSEYGRSVAMSDQHLFVGAPAVGTGHVEVFVRQGDQWNHDTTLTPSNGNNNDQFGWSLAAAGPWLFVGSPTADTTETNVGKVYVFEGTDTGWHERAILEASDPGAGDLFGFSVAALADELVVGSPLADGPLDSGSVYAFGLENGSWVFRQKVRPDQSIKFAQFGYSVAIDDGSLLVGEPSAQVHQAWVFPRQTDGSWANPQRLGKNAFLFGNSVTIEDDLLGVAASGEDDGEVFVYQWDGSEWAFLQKLDTERGGIGFKFGLQISLRDRVLAVGTPFHRDPDVKDSDTGAGYIYRWNGTKFKNRQVIIPTEAEYQDQFGRAIVTRDGQVLLAGLFAADSTGSVESGAAFVFDLSEITLSTSIADPGPGDTFDLITECGPSGTPVLVFVMDIGGTPFIQPILSGVFDDNSEYRVHVASAPTVGASVTLQSFSFNVLNDVVESNQLVLDL